MNKYYLDPFENLRPYIDLDSDDPTANIYIDGLLSKSDEKDLNFCEGRWHLQNVEKKNKTRRIFK